MKTLFAICVVAGVIALVDIPVRQSVGSGEALAQSRSSACFQNCANVRRWPASQCREYCRGKSKRFM
jgi:hypothetical protein